MSYIGNTQQNQSYVPAVDFFNGNGSTTAFTLSKPVASVAAIQVVVSNVSQKPGDAYTVSGSTITFTSAPPSGTNNIYVYYTSPNNYVMEPGQGTVSTNKIADSAVTASKLAAGVAIPAGAVQHFAMSAAPTGWLAANGAAVSRTTYATLFAAIGTTFGTGDGSTTFNVPNLGGQFIRSWISGQAIDSGRTFGSSQTDDNKSHNHGVTDPGHIHNYNEWGNNPGSNIGANAAGSAWWYNDATRQSASSGTGISIQTSGGTETRPVNVALLACIKY